MAKTNSGLIEYCKVQLGRPYWFGTFGQTASAALYKEKKKQYPKYYTASNFSSQYGQRVHDCAGLIKGYLWSETPDSPPKYKASEDWGATSFYVHCSKRGTIDSFDHIPGRLVFKGKDAKMTHVGVYIGDGKIIEAKGHAYGVIESKLDDKWTHWGQCSIIKEDSAPAPTPQPEPQPQPAPAPEPVKNNYKVKTNGSPLALRAAPNAKSVCLAWMPNSKPGKPTLVTVTGTSGSWSRTTYKGLNGWAFSKWLAKV